MKYTLLFASLVASILLMQSSADASCAAGPSISLDTTSAAPGGAVKVTGQYFTDGCHDVIVNGYVPPTLPAKKVRILLVWGKHTEQIGVADADKDFKLSVTVTIPANTPLGEASIVAEVPGSTTTRPVAIRVAVKDSALPKASGTK